MKALSIDETLAEAHTSVAIIGQLDWNWIAAETEYQRALELNPNHATTHFWYSTFLSQMGRHEEALVEARHAVEIDPLSLIINVNVGQTLYFARRYDEAGRYLSNIIEIDPTFWPSHYCIAEVYVQTGDFNKGIAALKHAITLSSLERDKGPETVGGVRAFGKTSGSSKGSVSASLPRSKYIPVQNSFPEMSRIEQNSWCRRHRLPNMAAAQKIPASPCPICRGTGRDPNGNHCGTCGGEGYFVYLTSKRAA